MLYNTKILYDRHINVLEEAISAFLSTAAATDPSLQSAITGKSLLSIINRTTKDREVYYVATLIWQTLI